MQRRPADLLELGCLDRRFELIEAVGVLHHLRDPRTGWRILAKLLAPRGRLRIGVYSRLGRGAVRGARELLQSVGLGATSELRAARRFLAGLPAGHPARAPCRLGDFYSTSSCRDLLFHVEENAMTLSEIEAAFEALGLAFPGFESLPPMRRTRRPRPSLPRSTITLLSARCPYGRARSTSAACRTRTDRLIGVLGVEPATVVGEHPGPAGTTTRHVSTCVILMSRGAGRGSGAR